DPSILAVSRDDISQMLNSKVTQAGLVMGTPSYMPPEQYLGIASDARSDQFSFCAALFWSLYRRRPFDPKKVAEAARSLKRGDAGEELTFGTNPVPTGVINEPPSRSSVPAWVRRAVLRGLSLLPQDRFPSMKALLDELSQEPRRVRRRQLALGAGLAVVVAAGVGVTARRNAQVCNGAELQVAQVWNPEVRKKLEDAFSATGKPFAREAAAGVVRVLDAYARDWSHEHKEACEATRVRGTQTEQLLSLRAVCLERRRKELGALARLLTTADARMMSRSMEAVDALPSLLECQDIDSLSAQVSLPADPARRARVELLNTEMAELKALGRAGRYDESVRLGAKLEHQVASIGYLPLQAELHANVGWAQQLLGDAEEGARLLELAVNEAEAARADRLKADAINKLVFVQGIQGRTEPTQQWARLAESSISRLGGDAELAAGLKGNLGNVALRQGRYDEARRYFEETRALQESILPQDHPRRIRTTYNLGLAALMIGEPARATQLLSDSLRRMEATLGKEHPEVSQCHSMLAWAYRDSGDPQRSLQHAEASVAIRKAVFGDGHPAVADALDAVGMTLIKLGRYDDARHTFEQAVAMKEKAMGPDNPALSYSYDGLGQTMLAAGRPEEAVAPLEKALSFEGVETEALAETGFYLARALLDSGRNPSRAFAHANKARAQFAEVKKPAKVAEVDGWLAENAQPRKVSFKLRRK
ncbi:MAG TPA: tetratricopeptide repeat-containing protein kinase family protein, partial [Myxococcaceae bacterium]|nr:tetratricopeptide repeat-containing protein kinase family protein [Myxococcaceae bacterium]